MYSKGLCKKSNEEHPMIHNPACWHYSTYGKCLKGDNCLFPHRVRGKSGQFVLRQDNGQAPAGRGGRPQADHKASAKDDKGKSKNDDPAKQGGRACAWRNCYIV